MRGADVIMAAQGWMGTPFHHQGRLRGVGVDCIGLVVGVGRELGVLPAHADRRDYARDPSGILLPETRTHLDEIEIADITPGCVLLMRWFAEPQHAAIYAGDSIIHAAQTFGRVVSHRYAEKWQKRTTHAFRFRGVRYE